MRSSWIGVLDRFGLTTHQQEAGPRQSCHLPGSNALGHLIMWVRTSSYPHANVLVCMEQWILGFSIAWIASEFFSESANLSLNHPLTLWQQQTTRKLKTNKAKLNCWVFSSMLFYHPMSHFIYKLWIALADFKYIIKSIKKGSLTGLTPVRSTIGSKTSGLFLLHWGRAFRPQRWPSVALGNDTWTSACATLMESRVKV